MPIALRPAGDVSLHGADTTALGPEPWMALEGLDLASLAGAFVEIIYSASLWDIPTRPVFRFTNDDGAIVDRIAPGPVAGRGIWTGPLPIGIRHIRVSPTNRPGRFGFRIDGIRRRSMPALLAEGLRWNPRSTRSAVLTRLIGWRPESDVNFMWAIGSRPLSTYAAWAERRARPLELTGLDRPRIDWSVAEPIGLFVTGGSDRAALQSTIASLQVQLFSRWTACVLDATLASADSRVSCSDTATALAASVGSPTAVVAAGDVLKPEALAMIAEVAARHPEARLFYGDETRRVDDRLEFVAHPGWSPRLQAARASLGVAFVRGFSAWTPEERHYLLASGTLPPAFVDGLAHREVVPLRRVLSEGHAVPRIPLDPADHQCPGDGDDHHPDTRSPCPASAYRREHPRQIDGRTV